MFHDEFAQDTAGDFLFSKAEEFLLDIPNSVFDDCNGEWTLFTGFAKPDKEFLTIEGFTALIAFDDEQRRSFDPFIGAETPFALLAFASAVDGVTDIAGVFDPRFGTSTKWTFHFANPYATGWRPQLPPV
jgi:hypothetical protein